MAACRSGIAEEKPSLAVTAAAENLPGWTPALVLHNLLALVGNMLQVYGVMVWGWDMFQILMLYWMETAVIGFWGLLRLAVLPEGLLGEMTVNGRVVAATNRLLLQMFVPFVAISMAAHLLILWAMFSGTEPTTSTARPASLPNSSSLRGPGSRYCSLFLQAPPDSIKARSDMILRASSGCCRSDRSPTSRARIAMASAWRSAARSPGS
jgi:hypothetical protein